MITRNLIGPALLAAAFAAATWAPHAALAQAPTCNEMPGPDCLYFPSAQYGFTPLERSVVYTDHAGEQREVKVLIEASKRARFPEVDRVEWFDLMTAQRKINPGQIGLLLELKNILS